MDRGIKHRVALVAADEIHRAKGVEAIARKVPLGRVGKPEEFANVVVFPASERAGYVTGVAPGVDGGIVKGLY